MRTFQFSDSKSHKFWNIEVSGNSFTVTYGKVGTAGQTSSKTWPSAEKAQAEADKLIREKTGKGYVETTPRAVSSQAEALEKAILSSPGDAGPWGAYADYLDEQDDPRGAFMNVQITLEDESKTKAERDALKKKEAAAIKAHGTEWLGGLAEDKDVEIEFSRGWIGRIVYKTLSVNQARRLAKAVEARFLSELIVENTESEAPEGTQEQYIDSYYAPGPDVPEGVDSYEGPSLHALCRCPHLPAVRVFRLGESCLTPSGEEEEYFNCHTRGDLAHHLVKQMPNIEELYLLAHRVDANKLFVLPMPKLRVLQLYHSNRYPLDKLAANKSVSNLTTLKCHPHAMDYDDEEEPGAYIRFSHLKAICRSPQMKNLTHLSLRLTDFGDKGIEEIISSGILKQLRVLDLSRGCVTDEGAEALAKSKDVKYLEFVNLSANAMTAKGTALIQSIGVACSVSAQHGQVPGGEGDVPEYLFEGDIE